jgi:hypothetical protein
MTKQDPLNFTSDHNKTWREENPDTALDHVNGVLWRISKIMEPFFEYLGWGLTFMSFIIWIFVIIFFIFLFVAIVVGIGSGILGIDLVPPADVARAMAAK